MNKNTFENKKQEINYWLLSICFSSYIILLIWVVIFKCALPQSILGSGYSLNPIQFGPNTEIYMNYTIKERFLYFLSYYDWAKTNYVVFDIIENIYIFFPIGIILPIYIKKHTTSLTILIGFLISLIFELFQLFTSFGGFDPVDLISNTLGAVIGVYTYNILKNYISNNYYFNKTINNLSLIISVFEVFILGYAMYSIAHNFDVIAFRFLYGIN